jgi:IS605 OrfB family transposase
LIEKAQGIGISIEEIEIMPDHVHLFIKASPGDAPHWIIQQLKGYTSRRLREECSELRRKHLAKHIADAGWGQFIRMLAYKGEWYGCDLVVVERFFPSSKTCSQCGTVMGKMPQQVRKWDCPTCHAHHEQDINAAQIS